MRRLFTPTIDTLFWLALAVWLGGLVTLCAAIIPLIAHGGILAAGGKFEVVAPALATYGRLAEIAGLCMVAIQFLERRRYLKIKVKYIWDGVRQVLTIGALLLAESCRYSLFPLVRAAESAGRTAPLTEYAMLSIAQVVMLVIVVGVTVWLQVP